MKKGILITMLLIIALWVCSIIDTHYNRKATIVSVNDNIVIAIDEGGNYWNFKSSGLTVDQRVTLIMDSMNTPSNLYDDKVVDVKLMK